MEQLSSNQSSDYDEIDLREVVGILVKRRAVIIFSTVAFAVVAFGINSAMPQVYRAQMAFEVGTTGEGAPVEGIAQVKDKIDQGLYTNLVKKAGISTYSIKTANTAGSDIISLTADGSDSQGVANFLNKIGEVIVADHNKIIVARRQTVQSQIEASKSYVESLKASANNPRTECSSEKYVAISEMESRVIDLEAALPQIQDTAVISTPSVSGTPMKSNVMTNTILGAFLGLFSGIFAVLLINWWKEGSKK
jgi:capsular polysaccharide biosynthesis protein